MANLIIKTVTIIFFVMAVYLIFDGIQHSEEEKIIWGVLAAACTLLFIFVGGDER